MNVRHCIMGNLAMVLCIPYCGRLIFFQHRIQLGVGNITVMPMQNAQTQSDRSPVHVLQASMAMASPVLVSS